LYVAVFLLESPCRLTVGRLGRFALSPGWYYYVGSAKVNRSARLARHARRDKPMRWHVDYLSRRARMLGAVLVDEEKWTECELAGALGQIHPRPIPRFGSGDCRCPGHLFHEPLNAPEPEAIR
jgi:sugar fermentation stimulation protein A